MTYGSNSPKGFQPARNIGGYTGTYTTNEYPITATNATAIFLGDAVSLSTLGTIQRCAATQGPALGVFMGTKYSVTTGLNYGAFAYPFWPGNPGVVTGTVPVALVSDDPNAVYTIQETDAAAASGTPLTQAAVGLNTTFVITAGSTVTGLSAFSLNNAATATVVTATCPVQILGLDPAVVLGVQSATPTINGGQQTVGAFANWLVKLNTNFYGAAVRPV